MINKKVTIRESKCDSLGKAVNEGTDIGSSYLNYTLVYCMYDKSSSFANSIGPINMNKKNLTI